MTQLHAQGVELVVNLLDAADNIERMGPEHIRRLLREAADVLGGLLGDDRPNGHSIGSCANEKAPPERGQFGNS
jgi:hypothetical protein